jgi:hypothetical protein
MDPTLSKRSQDLRTVVIKGVQLKTKRELRTSNQKISAKNPSHESRIAPQFNSTPIPTSTFLLNRMVYDEVC